MVGFLKRIWDHSEVQRWKRRAEQDKGPTSTVQFCRLLQRLGRSREAGEAARVGLERFPNSHELKDLLHATWKLSGKRAVMDLERRVGAHPTVENFTNLVDHLLEFNEMDSAASAVERLIEGNPDDPDAALLFGRVHLARFHRDHVARDGSLGLKSLLRAVELDPSNFTAHYSLAETYYYIGAISKALFHIYRALDSRGNDPDAKRLHSILSRLPLEKEEESELLREIEERDEAPFKAKGPEERATVAASVPASLLQRIEQVSVMAGVRRLAFCHRNRQFVAEGGRQKEVPAGTRDTFSELAAGFRRTASLSAKRMGIGAFEEAELSWEGGRIVAAAAGPTILLVDAERSPKLATIVAEVRNVIANCGTTASEDEHA